MTEEELARFKALLLETRAELSQSTESQKEMVETVELDQSAVGRLSRLDAIQAQQMAKDTVRRYQQQLVRIEAALRRVDAGEYGDCLDCGMEIDQRRLLIDPATPRCIKCAEKFA
ncbi:TraR/DksA family transcriptional regulator [Thioflexithrix psekupsensis]|uniref:Zinc finger DksA/TraR C4-type domain-containing protein n=1 Tax=Thioflexithrix psekupsensis TaxID=1570016 RepID=A0A251X9D8_9GAMM|nr:TraR/DksA family transcriptional regulator [Thioflexithrix psekupsensis]OUD14347.1 hypothetical protein TPSD3_08500 [Thioflexithrix psekupsensis]